MHSAARTLGIAAITIVTTITMAAPAQALPLNSLPVLRSLFSKPLPLPGFGDIAVDNAREQVFISGGPNSQGIVVTDFHGHVEATIDGQQGATGLALSEDGRTLYAALATGDAISAIDAESHTETARFGTGAQTCPTHLARTAGNVWYGYGCGTSWQGKIGKLDTAVQPPAVHGDMQGGVAFQQAPQLASGTGDAGPLAAGQPDLSLSHLQLYNTTGGNLATGASTEAAGSNLTDLAVSPDGKTVLTAAGSRDAVDAFATADLARAGSYASGPHPAAVAPSLDGGYLATGTASSTEDQVRIYRTGQTEPVKAVDVEGDDIAARGLAWSAENKKLFLITLNADGAPTLESVDHPVDDDWLPLP